MVEMLFDHGSPSEIVPGPMHVGRYGAFPKSKPFAKA
jgi:hypothetical protein